MDELISKLEDVVDNFNYIFTSDFEDRDVALAGRVVAKYAQAVIDWHNAEKDHRRKSAQ